MKRSNKQVSPARQKKRFVALARVSSREQEREGFSLDVQEEALRAYAIRSGGEIVKFYRIAETASKSAQRTTFKEMLAHARTHAAQLDGLLFYKIDRAARNLFDYVELERLEGDYDLPFISVSEPTENTAAGRLGRRMLATMASFYTERQSDDVKDGLAKRAQAGLFVGLTPYGYNNQRVNGRSLVVVDPPAAKNVQFVFDLYAFHHHTLDSLHDKLTTDGIAYTPESPAWPRSKLHTILRDRAYIGELKFKGQWLPGTHPPLIDRTVWDRVQIRLGEKTYKSHEMVFAGELIRCGSCGGVITGESITKQQTGKTYVYYRCANYTRIAGHPPVRLTEAKLDGQVVDLFRRIRQPEPVRAMFTDMLQDWAASERQECRRNGDDLLRQVTLLRQQQDELLNLRLLKQIDDDTYGRKATELRDRIAALAERTRAADAGRQEQAALASKVFELSQELERKWVGANSAEKRQLLDLVCLNFRLDDATLVGETRKPFDLLAEGLLISSSRGDRI